MARSILVLLILAVISSCSAPAVDQQAEAEKLMELSREWSKTAQTNDLEKTLSYWAEDAIVMIPDEPSRVGHAEIREMLETSGHDTGFEILWEPKQAFVSKGGDLGYTVGVNSISWLDSLGNKMTFFNKAVEVWKKQEDGSWKCVVDIFNSDPSLTSLQ